MTRPTPLPQIDEAREELARRQTALLRAMRGDGDLPAGFDLLQVRAAGESLARKRARTVQKILPGVSGKLGERFADDFEMYAALNPSPIGDATSDAVCFARWLRGQGRLPWEGMIELARLEAARDGWPRVIYLQGALAVVLRWRGIPRVIRWGAR